MRYTLNGLNVFELNLTRCDDIFERSGKINNSRCRKKKSFTLSNKFKLRYKASSSSNSETSTRKSPNRSAPSRSPSLPQTLKSKAQPRGAHGFGLVQAKLEREGRLSWILMHGSYFGWWFIYGCSVPKMELEHTYFYFFSTHRSFVTFPRSICRSVASMSSLWHHISSFWILDFAYFFILPGKVQFRNVNVLIIKNRFEFVCIL